MPTAPARRLTLVGRAYCHLCDDMRAALAPIVDRSGAFVVEVDVDADPALEAKFGERVPVLLYGGLDGAELCHFTLDMTRVLEALGKT